MKTHTDKILSLNEIRSCLKSSVIQAKCVGVHMCNTDNIFPDNSYTVSL